MTFVAPFAIGNKYFLKFDRQYGKVSASTWLSKPAISHFLLKEVIHKEPLKSSSILFSANKLEFIIMLSAKDESDES